MYIHYYICPQQLSNYVHTLLHLSTCDVESNSCQTMYICPPVICTYIITFVHNSCQTMYIHYYICPPVMWRVTAVKLYTLLHLSTCHVESNSCQTMYICPPVICTYIITFVHNSCQTMYIHYYICPPVMWRVTAVKLYTLLHLSTCHVESNSCQTMYICPPVICTYIITFVHNSCQTMYIHYYICPPVMWRVTAVKLYTLLHLSTCHVESNSCQTMYICPPVICTYIITFVHNSCQTMYIHYYICPPVMWRVTAVKLYTLLHLSTCHVESNSCQTMYICPPVICTYIITFVHNSCQTMYIHYYICPPVMWRVTAIKLCSNMYIHYYICPPVMWRVTAVKL